MGQNFHVCIFVNPGLGRRPLYIGVTPDLARRVAEYREGERGPLAARFGKTRLVFVETYEKAMDALRREEEIRKLPRHRQDALVTAHNPAWIDLAEEVDGEDGSESAAESEPAPTASRSPDTSAPSARSPRAA